MRKCLLASLVLSANLFLVGCADDTARQQIADTNTQLSQLQQNVGLLGSKVSNQKGLELVNTLDGLQNQIDQLNGNVDTLRHNLESYQATQDQLYQSLQQQIQNLQQVAPVSSASAPVKAISASSSTDNSGAQLKSALKKVKGHDFPAAISQLKNIISTARNPTVTADATYYLAVSYAANGQYKDSIATSRKFVDDNPQNRNAPDALLTMYISQTQLGMKKSAANTAKIIINNYPDSAAAKKLKKSAN